MKISYRNTKPLEYLKNNKLGIMPHFQTDAAYFDEYSKMFGDDFKVFVPSFKQEVNIISDTFYDAVVENQSSLMKVWQDIVSKDAGDIDIKGAFVDRGGVHMLDYQIRKDVPYHKVAYYMFSRRTGAPMLMHIDYTGKKDKMVAWCSNFYQEQYGIVDSKGLIDTVWGGILTATLYSMFKKYAKVETKHLAAHTKQKDFHCKYLNDTDLPITYLNSTWWNNLVKSDGFKVRGHIRLQPKKDEKGSWTKEFIWIDEFQKTGYTAPARKIAYEEGQANV